MNRQEKDYLYARLQTETTKAKNTYAERHPTKWSYEDVHNVLVLNGFVIIGSPSNIPYYVTLPPTEEMERNRQAVDAFNLRIADALARAKDRIYLGNADALAILAEFQQQLDTMVEA